MDNKTKIIRHIDELCQWLQQDEARRIEILVHVVCESLADYDDKLTALRMVRTMAEHMPTSPRVIRESQEARNA